VEKADDATEVGLISPMIHWYGQPEKVQFCGYYLDSESYSFRKLPLPHIPDDEVRKKDIILWGTALLIKRRVVEDIGYLDEKYFAYAEDSEYCMRAKRFGYQSIIQPSARIYHKDSQSTGSIKSPLQVYLRSRNTYFFWMDTLNGRRRKIHYSIFFFANTISKFAGLRGENLLEAADACLDGAWAAIRGIGGPWNKNVKMPRIVKRILSWHPYFWVGLLRGNMGGILHTSRNRLREWERDVGGE
jgi:GT2 family glycosyltransferase